MKGQHKGSYSPPHTDTKFLLDHDCAQPAKQCKWKGNGFHNMDDGNLPASPPL